MTGSFFLTRRMMILAGIALLASAAIYRLLGPSAIRLGLDVDQQTELKIFVLGDQGSGQLRQWRVALSMERVAETIDGGNFVLLAGDNFYSGGIQSIHDIKWRYEFENVYQGEYLLGMPFYAVLGNHDVLGNVEALIEYSKSHRGTNRWRMEARHYYKDFGYTTICSGASLVRVVFLDTTTSASTLAEEAAFLKESLMKSSALWKIVIGHHPIRNYGGHGESEAMKEEILPVLVELGVDLYISGHDHNQQVIQRQNEPMYLISGAGGKSTYPVDISGEYLLGSSQENGFSTLTINNGTLGIDFYTMELDHIPLQHFELESRHDRLSDCARAAY